MADRLGDRQASILRAIVREYIRTGEPIGSKHLVERAKLGVSAATVRNEMARLEELGYLTHPHTSAGRTPTDAGYRFIVDGIKRPRALGHGQQRALAEGMGDEPGTIDDLMRRAGEVLSRYTNHASALLALRARSRLLRRIELFRVGDGRAMVVAIAEDGRIEQRIVAVPRSMGDDQVRELGETLSATLHGRGLDSVVSALEDLAASSPEADREALNGVRSVIEGLRDAEQHVVIGGVSNLAGDDDFAREDLYRLTEALEQQTAVMEILSGSFEQPVSVRIGGELNDEDFRTASVVVAPFGPTAAARGSVGVIGPMRMDYDRVIATAHAVARLIEETLGASDAS